MRVALLFDGGSESWTEADIAGVLDNIRQVQRSLRQLGHRPVLVPVTARDLRWARRVQRCDLVFNLLEGIDGQAACEDWAVGTLELTGVPFTGCRAGAITLCHRKHVANTLLAHAGLPVPRFVLGRPGTVPKGLRYPVIVKPSGEDASVGIDGEAVCRSAAALRARLAAVAGHFAEIMVQEYVPGREFNVGFLGDRALPVSEISFARMPKGHWPIVSYAAKWAEGSPEYLGTEPVCPAAVDDALGQRIVDVARSAWQLLGGGHGYGRVDLRVDPEGSPWVLEVNPNPDLSADAGFARMARAIGWDYDALVDAVMREALARAPHPVRQPQTAPGA